MSEVKVEYIATSELVPYARNSRTHCDEQVAQIMGSIREFGFTNPVLIDSDCTIIAGHGRVLAATRLELENIPCIRLSHLTDTQRQAYVIADNQLALKASWDDELLAIELGELNAVEFDLSLLGFEADELEKMLIPKEDEQAAPEDFPEVDDDIETEHQCPKCGYEWSGKSS